MITGAVYKHKRTGEFYRTLLTAFSVELQQESVVYVSGTGQTFVRNTEDFDKNFELTLTDAHESIVKKEATYVPTTK